MTPDETAKRLAILKTLSKKDLGVIHPEMCYLLDLLADRDAEIVALKHACRGRTISCENCNDSGARIAKLEAALNFIQSEVTAVRAEKESRARGGMHTNGPMPRLYHLPESGLHMLERECREALK